MARILKITDNLLKYGKPPAILKTRHAAKGLVIVDTYIRSDVSWDVDVDEDSYRFIGETSVKKVKSNKWEIETSSSYIKIINRTCYKTRKEAYQAMLRCIYP
jgi:hypothetical protein